MIPVNIKSLNKVCRTKIVKSFLNFNSNRSWSNNHNAIFIAQ